MKYSSFLLSSKIIDEKEELIEDNEIIIMGYPTEYIITFLKNNQNINKEDLDNGFTFELNYNNERNLIEKDEKKIEIRFRLVEISSDDLISSISKSKRIFLSKNIFFKDKTISYGEDFVGEELTFKNNILLNMKIDRIVYFEKIVIPLIENNNKDKFYKKEIYTNRDSVNINKLHETALKNMLFGNKIGNYSLLWNESLEDKINNIIKTKFQLIYYKLMVNLSLSDDLLDGLNSYKMKIIDNLNKKKQNFKMEIEKFLFKFKSYDKWYSNLNHMNSEFDILVESERKSPCVVVIGKPFIGITSLCKRISKEVDLVHISLEDFLLKNIQEATNKYNEVIENYVEENENDQNNDDNNDELKVDDKIKPAKKQKPVIKDYMTPLEYDVYTDVIINKGPLRIQTLRGLYDYYINESEGTIKGVLIESSYEIKYIVNEEEISLSNLILNGYLGNIKIDYIIDLSLSDDEVEEKFNDIRNYIKTVNKLASKDLPKYFNPIDKKKKVNDEGEELNEDEEEEDEKKEDEEQEKNEEKEEEEEEEEDENVMEDELNNMDMENLDNIDNMENMEMIEENINNDENKEEDVDEEKEINDNIENEERENEENEKNKKNVENPIQENNEELKLDKNENQEQEQEEAKNKKKKKKKKEKKIEVFLTEEDVYSILNNLKNEYELEKNNYLKYFNQVHHLNSDKKFIEKNEKPRQVYYIDIDTSGIENKEISNILKSKFIFNKYPRYIPLSLEPSSHKNLLTDGKEGISPFRKWSMWKDYDVTSLKDDFLILKGNPEYGVEYCGRVFIFISQENKNKFMKNPKKYTANYPVIPNNYRIAIIGPPKSGKKTIAKMLNELYNYKVINIDEIANSILDWQKSFDEHIPNNRFYNKIHFSLDEFKEIIQKKKSIDFYSKIIFMLDELGIQLNRKCTLEEEMEERENNNMKYNYLLNPPNKKRLKKKIVPEDNVNHEEDENLNNNNDNDDGNDNYNIEKLNERNEDKIGDNDETNNKNDIIKDDNQIDNSINDELDNIINKQEKAEDEIEEWETDTQFIDPYPPEDEYIVQELKSNQFYYAYDEKYNFPRPGGFVVISHPINEEEIKKFKEFNIVFDKIIYLCDESEEPLKELMNRNKPDFHKLDENKQQEEIGKMQEIVSKFEDILSILRNEYNVNEEDCIIKLNISDTIEGIKEKLNIMLNPFIDKIDDEEKYYTSSEFGNERIQMPFGEYGKYCPVTLIKENWLISGISEEELTINHRRYVFASKRENEEFRKNLRLYINNMNYLNIPKPKFFIIGQSGAGVKTLMNKLSHDYKLSIVELKMGFIKKWEQLKGERKKKRIENKKKQIADEREERRKQKEENKENIENEEPEQDIDELIANDATLDDEEDYNANEENLKIFKSLFDASLPCIYNSNWYEMSEKVSMSLSELMIESKRIPDVIIVIKSNLKSIIKRNFNEEEIKIKHKILEKESLDRKDEAFRKLREEKRKELEEALTNEFNAIEEPTEEEKAKYEFDLLANKENEPEVSEEERENIYNAQDELLPELTEMINKEKEIFITKFESESTFINEFVESIKVRVPIIEIDNNKAVDYTIKKLYNLLEPYIKNRDNLIERQLCNYIGELSTEEEVVNPELSLEKIRELKKSHVYINSSYGELSPIHPEKYNKDKINTNYPIVYRDKIYYFNSIEERDIFLKTPKKYSIDSELRLDLVYNHREIVYVIGDFYSGKSTICNLFERFGYYIVNIHIVIQELKEKLYNKSALYKEILQKEKSGDIFDNLTIGKLIKKRIEMSDLNNKSLVFDGIPFTEDLFHILKDEGVYPNLIVNIQSDIRTILKRCYFMDQFNPIKDKIIENIEESHINYKTILNYFYDQKLNILTISSEKSKWNNETIITDFLEKHKNAKLSMISQFNTNKPSLMSNLLNPYLKNLIYSSLNDLNFYSPVSLKVNNTFVFNKYSSEYISFYKDRFFFFNTNIEFDLFISSPDLYYSYLKNLKYEVIPPKATTFEMICDQLADYDDDEEEDRNDNEKRKEINDKKNIEYQGSCPVAYYETGSLIEGSILYCCEYKEKFYTLSSASRNKKFLDNPEIYVNLNLPVKKNSEKKDLEEKKVNFLNTVNYLETNFGQLLTKGMLELSKNRIKYPFIDTKESSIKYLALFLKANNTNNKEYAKNKYLSKLNKFVNNSKLPFDLLRTYEEYNKSDKGSLKQKFLLRELDKLSVLYDELMEEAKIQKNMKFEGFFNSV